MPKFIPGLKLCELFFKKEVRQILSKNFSTLCYSAAVIGWGSEVQFIDSGEALQQLSLVRRFRVVYE